MKILGCQSIYKKEIKHSYQSVDKRQDKTLERENYRRMLVLGDGYACPEIFF